MRLLFHRTVQKNYFCYLLQGLELGQLATNSNYTMIMTSFSGYKKAIKYRYLNLLSVLVFCYEIDNGFHMFQIRYARKVETKPLASRSDHLMYIL